MTFIRLTQFPNFLYSVLTQKIVLSRNAKNARTLNICYFSCQSYYKYLYCSLHSLKENIGNIPLNIYIFNDSEQPLSIDQIAALTLLMPKVNIILWPKSMGWGSVQIANIWQAYAIAATGAREGDIVARIDSDVFFFNDKIFQMVIKSDADLIGDGHFVAFKYCQGGCYFFKASAVKQINQMITEVGIDNLLTEVNIAVEDVAATHFAKRLKMKIWQTWFMMFPDELRNTKRLNRWFRWKFSCLHFVMKNKDFMLTAYDENILLHKPDSAYHEALKII